MKQARVRAGLTQADLARRAGTTQSTIARLEAGKVSPRLETLDRLIEACGFALDVTISEPNTHDIGLALSNAKLTPEQRMERFTSGLQFARELRDAGRTS